MDQQSTQNNNSSQDQPYYHDRYRDEAENLRAQVTKLRLRVEEVEEESNYNAAKARELEDILKSRDKDALQQALVEKSLLIAELSTTIQSLQAENAKLSSKDLEEQLINKSVEVADMSTTIQFLESENAKILWQLDLEASKQRKLSAVLRALQPTGEDSDSEEEQDKDVVLTPEKATGMALKRMKDQVEVLEDEYQILGAKFIDEKSKTKKLEHECDLKDTKISVLTELFHSIGDSHVNPSFFTHKTINHNNETLFPSHDLFNDLKPKAKAFREAVRVKDHTYHLKTFPKFFGRGKRIRTSLCVMHLYYACVLLLFYVFDRCCGCHFNGRAGQLKSRSRGTRESFQKRTAFVSTCWRESRLPR